MASTVVIASSTNSVSAMIRAPSEMRCRSMWNNSMIGNTIASVSGIDSATTVPGRTPRLTKLAAMMITIACHKEVVNSLIARSTVTAWSATRVRLDADRQLGLDLGHRPLDVAAERQDVAAVAHRDREPDRGLAVHPEHRLRRVGIAAADLGDVAQADDPVAGDEVDVQEVELGIERARDPQRDPLVAGLQDACGPDGVLRLERGDQRRIVEAQRGQALGRELEEDLLVLGAEDLDLGDVGDQEQARARILDEVAQLAMGEAVGREAVDDAEDVAELVIEERPDHPARQRVPDVADLLAHVVPAVRHLAAGAVAAQIDEDRGEPGAGVAGQEVEAGDLLELALDALGHLRGRCPRGSPRASPPAPPSCGR